MTDDRFPASIRRHHQTVLSNVMGRLQQGQVFALTPQEYVALGDLAGALNYWAAQVPQYDVTIQPEIGYGDFERKLFQVSDTVVTAFPFRVPSSPPGGWPGPNGGLLRMSTSEYQGQRALRQCSVSATPGDVSGVSNGIGTEAGAQGNVGAEFPEGAYLYANIVALEPVTAGGSGFSIIWPPVVWP